MKKPLIILAFSVLVLDMQACQNNNRGDSSTKKEIKTTAKYSCPMHPALTADKPGTCPKCGMKLVERDSAGKK